MKMWTHRITRTLALTGVLFFLLSFASHGAGLVWAEPTVIEPPDRSKSPPPPPPPPVEETKKPSESAKPKPKEKAEVEEVGMVGIGPGFVFRESLGDWAPSVSLVVRYGEAIASRVAINTVALFSIYDFEGIGEGYAWLFEKDSPQVVSAVFLMWLVPLWYSHNFFGGSVTIYLTEVPTLYLDLGLGFSSVLLQNRCFFPGWGGTGALGVRFSGGFTMELNTYASRTFSENGGAAVSSMLTIGFSD